MHTKEKKLQRNNSSNPKWLVNVPQQRVPKEEDEDQNHEDCPRWTEVETWDEPVHHYHDGEQQQEKRRYESAATTNIDSNTRQQLKGYYYV